MAARQVELGPGLCCAAACACGCGLCCLLLPRSAALEALPRSSPTPGHRPTAQQRRARGLWYSHGTPTSLPRPPPSSCARSTGRLRLQLERADRRGVHWRVKQQPQPAGSADRVAAMQGELQLLELAARLRERLAEQNEALVLLEVEERALSRRLREALKNRA